MGLLERRAEARALNQIRQLLTADPLKGDYCLALQEPFDQALYDAYLARGRSGYCLEARSVGSVCPAQCKWGIRIASNRARSRAIQSERERIAAGAAATPSQK